METEGSPMNGFAKRISRSIESAMMQGGWTTTNQVKSTSTNSHLDEVLSEVKRLGQEIRDASTVWYAVSNDCPVDSVMMSPASQTSPKYFIVHPDLCDRFLAEVPSFMVARPLGEYFAQQRFNLTANIVLEKE